MFESSEIVIHTSDRDYRVKIGKEIMGEMSLRKETVWFVDKNVAMLHGDMVPSSSILQEAVESAKSLQSVAQLVERLRDQGGTRHTQLVAVGGGIVQDLATFSASCYMRGIAWIYCPTTLLSMVDSCIGGKSSINVGRYKNIAGNFYPPEEVLIDTKFCHTLTNEQMAEGLCEAAKICYASSDECFNTYLKLVEGESMPPRKDEKLKNLIAHSLGAKQYFIEEDEFDNGIRLLLNFGHTFGHAIEGATSYAISHGIAVGLGMLAAADCSVRLGHVSADSANVEKLVVHLRRLLGLVPDVTEKLIRMDTALAMECFLSDKKHSSEAFTLILFNQEGRLQRVRLPRSEAIHAELLSSFQHLKEQANEI